MINTLVAAALSCQFSIVYLDQVQITGGFSHHNTIVLSSECAKYPEKKICWLTIQREHTKICTKQQKENENDKSE